MSNPVTVLDLVEAGHDCAHIKELARSAALTATDRNGRTKLTMQGALVALGYQAPVVYAAGINLTAGTQTVEYNGLVYAPKIADVPVTTTGAFEASKFRPLPEEALRLQLAQSNGSELIGHGPSSLSSVLAAITKPPIRFSPPPRQRYDAAYVAGQFARDRTSFVEFGEGSGALQYVQIVAPVVSGGGAVKARFYIEGINDVTGPATTTGYHAAAGTCTNLQRAGYASITPTVTHRGSTVDIEISSPSASFVSVDLRAGAAITGRARVYKVEVYQGSNMLAFSQFDRLPASNDWGGGVETLTKTFEGLGMDMRIQISIARSSSRFVSPSEFYSEPAGSSSNLRAAAFGFELNLRLQSIMPEIKRWRFAEGAHYPYRRSTALSLSAEAVILGEGAGATIYAGRELSTSDWTQIQTAPHVAHTAPYDWSSNPDSAIRAGTKQPFVCVDVPQTLTRSAASYKLSNVASAAAVLATPMSYWYDHANKRLHFSWDASNNNAYIYVAEADNGIVSATSLYAANVTVAGSKTDNWQIMPANYVPIASNGRFCGLYNCRSIATVGGSGFAIDRIDSEQVQCVARSSGNDGFNYHFEGISLLRDCDALYNSADGISHHESCVGYVVDTRCHYNYVAGSVPAFGAKVWHYRCSNRSASIVGPQIYAGTFAALSGSGQNTEAYYQDCLSDDAGVAPSHYFSMSQQAGTTVSVYIDRPLALSTVKPMTGVDGAGASVSLTNG